MEAIRDDVRTEARHDGTVYRRIELNTGERRRRTWSEEEKARILTESALPGANVSAVARRHGVNRGVLTAWRREAGLGQRRQGSRGSGHDGPLFVPVEIVPEIGEARPSRIEVEIGRLAW